MENQAVKRLHPLYVLSVFYVAAIYLFPVLWFTLNGVTEGREASDSLSPSVILQLLTLLIPGVMGLINLAVVIIFRNRITREQLLHCAVIIKYGLIPFFLVGGCCIALTWLMTFSPVVIMIFIGPAVAAFLSALGYISMLGSAPFSVAYLIRSRREHVHSPQLLITGGIMQFFFALDTISLMFLALKEKKCVKPTIILGVLLAVGYRLILAMIVFLIVKAIVNA